MKQWRRAGWNKDTHIKKFTRNMPRTSIPLLFTIITPPHKKNLLLSSSNASNEEGFETKIPTYKNSNFFFCYLKRVGPKMRERETDRQTETETWRGVEGGKGRSGRSSHSRRGSWSHQWKPNTREGSHCTLHTVALPAPMFPFCCLEIVLPHAHSCLVTMEF